MKIHPLHRRIIIKRPESDRRSAPAVLVPDTAAKKRHQREAAAAGKGRVLEDGKMRAIDLKVSDRVLFDKYVGQTVQIEGEELLVRSEKEFELAESATAGAIGVMGGKTILGRAVKTEIDLSDLIVRGLPVDALESVKRHSALTDSELALSLGVSTKTLTRLRATKSQHKKVQRARLNLGQGERLFRLARLMAIAEQVFEDQTRAQQWFRQPQRGLGNRIPLDLMRTEVGSREIEDLLGRIEHGVYS